MLCSAGLRGHTIKTNGEVPILDTIRKSKGCLSIAKITESRVQFSENQPCRQALA